MSFLFDSPKMKYHSWNMSKWTFCAKRSSHSLTKLELSSSLRHSICVVTAKKKSASAERIATHYTLKKNSIKIPTERATEILLVYPQTSLWVLKHSLTTSTIRQRHYPIVAVTKGWICVSPMRQNNVLSQSPFAWLPKQMQNFKSKHFIQTI